MIVQKSNNSALGRRVYTLVFVSILLLVFYFVNNQYRSVLAAAEDEATQKLLAVAKLSANQIDGDLHQILSERYTSKNAVTKNDGDSIYNYFHQQLLQIQNITELSTPIYTLVKSKNGNYFEFIVTSANEPYFRHSYTKFPDILMQDFETGGAVGLNKSENGLWLSAFAPILNRKGEVVAVIQADKNFKMFIEQATKKMWVDLSISGVIVILVLFYLIRNLRKVIRSEDLAKTELHATLDILKEKNRDISDSIAYAKYIQDAIIPKPALIHAILPDSYMFFRGKDIVSGDFPFISYNKEVGAVFIAAVDCTGHGVPGAFLSIIGNFLLKNIIEINKESKPSEILRLLNNGVVETLNSYHYTGLTTGMDIALVRIDLKKKVICFSGANRPLLLVGKDGLTEIKGTKQSIGGKPDAFGLIPFEEHMFPFDSFDAFHISSDGFADQFGGKEGKKLMKKRLFETLVENYELPMEEKGEEVQSLFFNWKQETEQTDDVLIIGVRCN